MMHSSDISTPISACGPQRAARPLRQRRRVPLLVGLATALLGCAALAGPALPTVQLRVGQHTVRAELADTPQTLKEGLMHRKALAADQGMLFMLGAPDIYCFWMKNTLIPLSIAFIDAQGHIISIQDMRPGALDPHCPPAPVTAALEMNQGWFTQADAATGTKIKGLPGLR
ncbi:hypothetical protein CCAE64S_02611 [Castellaniella caeni]